MAITKAMLMQHAIPHNQWFSLANMGTARSFLSNSASIYNNNIYVFGTDGTSPTTCEKYDIANNSWSSFASTPTNRTGRAIAETVGSLIYLIGGGSATTANEIYNPNTDTWSTGASLPVGLTYISSTVYNGKIYIPGGFAFPGTASNILRIYDPVGNSWSTGTNLPSARYATGCAFDGTYIWLLGGVNSSGTDQSTLWRYDPVGNSWTTGYTSRPSTVSYTRLEHYNGKLYSITSANTYIYDIASDSWTTGQTMPNNLFDLATVIDNGIIYEIGGKNTLSQNVKTLEKYVI